MRAVIVTDTASEPGGLRREPLTWHVVTIGMTVCGVLISVMLYVSGQVEALGRWIPQRDIQRDYLWGVVAWLALYGALQLLPLTAVERRMAHVAWAARYLVTLVAMLFYENNYSFLDSYTYFNVPSQGGLHELSLEFGKGTEVVYSLNALLYAWLPYSFHATKVIYSFIGLLATIVIYRTFVSCIGREDEALFLLLSCFPSAMFWSSTLGKDPLVLLGIALFIFGVVRAHSTGRFATYAGVAIVGMIGAMWIRPWIGIPLSASLIALFGLGARQRIWLAAAAVLAVLTLLAVAERMDVWSSGDTLEALDTQSRGWSEEGGSSQVIHRPLDSGAGAVAFAPIGAFTAVFRPLPGEVTNLFGWLAGLENAFLLGFFVVAVATGRRALVGSPFMRFLLAYGVVWAIMYGFVSYQNLGTAVRFKLQVLPFLIGFIYCLLRHAAIRTKAS